MATKSIFKERIKTNVPRRNAFNLDHEKSFTFAFGQLIPIFWADIIPSDKFRVRSNVLLRLPPLFAPIMSRLDCFIHYFFVRYNLIMRSSHDTPGFDEWFTEDPEYDTANGIPYITLSAGSHSIFDQGGLPDYFGLPAADNWGSVTQDIDINALPFLAYQKIYDDYYRDQVLQETLNESAGIDCYRTEDLTSSRSSVVEMQYVNYEKDYFTSALTTAYVGSETDVILDLDTYGDVSSVTDGIKFRDTGGNNPAAGSPVFSGGDRILYEAGPGQGIEFSDGSQQPMIAQLEILELRRAEALMRYYELSGRAGRRYTEHMLALFGVITDDSRHNFPRYLGGGRVPIEISEVVSQAETLVPSSDAVSTPLGGPLAGHAQAAGSSNSFTASFNEHGIVIGLMFVRPRTAYKEGIDRYWRKFDREDYYNPYLQHIGDQAILQSEIFYDEGGTDADDEFGYAPRWSEYKWMKSTVAGEMNYQESMDHWTMTQFYGSAPSLNSDFIICSPARDEFNRIYSVTGLDQIYANVYNQVTAIRPMDRHDIGGNVQH